ncbi:MAG: TIGR04551 family protein [Myxococcota bacterium]
MLRWNSGALAVGWFVNLAGPGVLWAQTGSSTSAVDLEALKQALRDELKEELKAEIKQELAEESAALAPVQSDSWAEADWSWDEPAEPKLNFLEFDGYFRFRWDLFNNLDLNTFFIDGPEVEDIYGPFPEPFLFAEDLGPSASPNPEPALFVPPGQSPPVPLCITDFGDGGCREARLDDDLDTLASANMRLRLEPTLNVYEDIKIKSQIDILDNVILGSTPDSLPFNPISPLAIFSNTQIAPSDGTNAVFRDSIRVNRVWGEVMTPVGQIRFGRQPNHFGLGILANDGNQLDDDFGDSVDRVQFSFKLGDFYIMPAYDWIATGPISSSRFEPQGQPFDRGERDDVEQWNLRLEKRETEESTQQKLANDQVVWNAALRGTFRRQAFDVPNYYRFGLVEDGPLINSVVERDSEIGTVQAYLKVQWRKLELELEYAGMFGNIGNQIETRDVLDDGSDAGFGAGQDLPDLDINQHGGALRTKYKLLSDRLSIEFLFAFATGDAAPGWGVRPLFGTAPEARAIGSVWDGFQGQDGSITNFRFNPAFTFDVILWRQLVGTFTDGLVFRPSIQYNFTEALGARLDIIYSRALFSQSTPSNSLEIVEDLVPTGDEELDFGNPSENLGLEFDTKIFFDSDDGFHAWVQYALFVPFGGLNRLVPAATLPEEEVTATFNGTQVQQLDAGVAHSLQILLAITF